MLEYLYVATNTAMPGLVKVGYTTRGPTERMRELRTTGVPSPFDLQLVLVVANGLKAEQTAHKLLNFARESTSREFFRIPVEKALGLILTSVEYQSVDWAYTSKNSNCEVLVRRYLTEKLSKIDQRLLEVRKRIAELEASLPIEALNKKVSELSQKLVRLGSRPKQPESNPDVIAVFAYYPLPIGWVFWMGVVAQLFEGNIEFALGLSFCIFLGFLVARKQSKEAEMYERSLLPWTSVEAECSSARDEIDKRLGLNESLRVLLGERALTLDQMKQVTSVNDSCTKSSTQGVSAIPSVFSKPEGWNEKPPREFHPDSSVTENEKIAVVIHSINFYKNYQIFTVADGVGVIFDGDFYIYESKGFLQKGIESRLESSSDDLTDGLVRRLSKNTFYPTYPSKR